MKDVNEIKQGVTDTFNEYFNDLRKDYNIDDADVYKLRMKLLKEVDSIIVVEKKQKK